MQTETISQEASLPEIRLVEASTGKRFLNYLIDLICFYSLFFFWGIILAIVNPSAIESLKNDDGNFGSWLLERLFTLLIFGIFIGFLEAIFKGKTPGKFVTGTKAVNEYDGSDISIVTAFKRGFSRIVPFEPFSAFGGYPWHDSWTNTIVIDQKETRRQSAEQETGSYNY